MIRSFVRKYSLPVSLGVVLFTALLVGGTFGPAYPTHLAHGHSSQPIAPRGPRQPKSPAPLPTPPRPPEHPLSSSTIAVVYAATVPVTQSIQSLDEAKSTTALRHAWSQYQQATRHLRQVVQHATRPIPPIAPHGKHVVRPIPPIAPHLTHVPVPARPAPKVGAHHSTAQVASAH